MKMFRMAVVWLILTGSAVHGDSWALEPEVKDTEFVFGDTRIVLHYDSMQDRSFPRYTLRILENDQLVAEHEGIGFEQIFASPDQTYFLGVSNSGLIKDAYVIFGRDGRIVKRQPHDPRKVKYHEVSVTLIRKWYDPKNPDVTFEIKDGVLRNATINSGGGQRVFLLSRAEGPKQPEGWGGVEKSLFDQPGAVFTVREGKIQDLRKGRELYTDRDHTLKERPNQFATTRYILAPFSGAKVHCERGGVAFLLALLDPINEQQTKRVQVFLEENKWNLVKEIPKFTLFYFNGADRPAQVYWKMIAQGEDIVCPNGSVLCFREAS